MKQQFLVLALIPVVLVTLTGCQTPDLKPFADSTANLSQAVVRSQNIVRSELRGLRTLNVVTNKDKLIQAEANFTQAFTQRIAFMEAVVSYSDSLAAVADAGKNGQANAQALGDSVKQLADAAGPYGTAVGVGADVVAKIYGLAAQALAVHSLEEATSKADPFIAAGAEILQKDMQNIGDILATAEVSTLLAMQKPYQKSIKQRNHLIAFRDEQSEEIDDAIKKPNWDTLIAAYNKKTAEVNALIDSTDRWYLPLQEQQNTLSLRLAAEIRLMDQTAAGFKEWKKVHADLAKALKDNRQPNIRLLVSTVLEIKAEIEGLKKH